MRSMCSQRQGQTSAGDTRVFLRARELTHFFKIVGSSLALAAFFELFSGIGPFLRACVMPTGALRAPTSNGTGQRKDREPRERKVSRRIKPATRARRTTTAPQASPAQSKENMKITIFRELFERPRSQLPAKRFAVRSGLHKSVSLRISRKNAGGLRTWPYWSPDFPAKSRIPGVVYPPWNMPI